MSTYDLESRTLAFATDVRKLCRQIDRTISNIEDMKQLIRSSGSVGANYIEANESLSKNDLAHRLRIARKEAKESRYWLQLISVSERLEPSRARLFQESTELLKILSSIIEKIS